MRSGRLGHFLLIAPHKGRPVRRACRSLAQLHRLGTRGQIGEPDVIPVLRRKLGLGHAAWRAAHGADAQAFIGESGGAEAEDVDGHY